MDFKEKLISSFMVFEQDVDLSNPVHEIRSKSLKKFEEKGFPNKKQEAWKYTSLAKILKSDYGIFPKKEVTIELKDVQKYFLELNIKTMEPNPNQSNEVEAPIILIDKIKSRRPNNKN